MPSKLRFSPEGAASSITNIQLRLDGLEGALDRGAEAATLIACTAQLEVQCQTILEAARAAAAAAATVAKDTELTTCRVNGLMGRLADRQKVFAPAVACRSSFFTDEIEGVADMLKPYDGLMRTHYSRDAGMCSSVPSAAMCSAMGAPRPSPAIDRAKALLETRYVQSWLSWKDIVAEAQKSSVLTGGGRDYDDLRERALQETCQREKWARVFDTLQRASHDEDPLKYMGEHLPLWAGGNTVGPKAALRTPKAE